MLDLKKLTIAEDFEDGLKGKKFLMLFVAINHNQMNCSDYLN